MENVKNGFRMAFGVILGLLAWYSLLPTIFLRWKSKYDCSHRGGENGNVLYLTFQDGPDIRYTGQLLELLRKYEIKATFFVIASNAINNPVMIKRMRKEGHSIQLHCLTHRNALFMDPFTTEQHLSEAYIILKKVNSTASMVCPAWGCVNLSMLSFFRKYGMKLVIPNVTVADWRAAATKQSIAEKLLERTRPGDIICLHDGRGRKEAPERMLEALKIVLPVWKNKGYEFKCLKEEKSCRQKSKYEL
ncbi:MAG: polysaccharide deacetylase family protein [bacterium]|nr:polysaccharide deacetylase family protein [bacterium]